MPKIVNWANFGGVGVPQGEDNRFLDWRHVTGRGKEEPLLTSPYGPGAFVIGNAGQRVLLDYCEMPDTRFIVDITGDTGLLSIPHLYLLLDKSEVLSEAWTLTENIIHDLKMENVIHDFKAFGADGWFFFRALAHHVGHGMYAAMETRRLRFEDPIRYADLQGTKTP